MRKKRFLIPILCAAVLASCGKTDRPQQNAEDDSQQTVTAVQPTEAPIIQAKPQTTAFPLTGMPLAEGMQQAPRPIAVMVDNTRAAYPQWGISDAQVVVEAVTEGGITRLMCLYNEMSEIQKTGPVRSVRDMFLQIAMPLNAIPVHIGASSFANNFLTFYNWNTVDAINVGVNTFDFDHDRALVRDAAGKKIGREHCWYVKGESIRNGITLRNIVPDGSMFPFVEFEQTAEPKGEAATQIQVNYSFASQSGFSYNAESGVYLKTSYDNQPHTDANNGVQLAFQNLLLLRCKSYLKPDGVHTDFNLSGGKGWWIAKGKIQPIVWKKISPEQPIQLFDTQGDGLKICTGKTYLGFLNGTSGESLMVESVQLLDGSLIESPVLSPTQTPSPNQVS